MRDLTGLVLPFPARTARARDHRMYAMRKPVVLFPILPSVDYNY